jgi:hypothetical protein
MFELLALIVGAPAIGYAGLLYVRNTEIAIRAAMLRQIENRS